MFRAPKNKYFLTIIFPILAVLLYLRSVWHVCVGDELRYFYQFALKPGQSYFGFKHLKAVASVGDVWRSQLNHYFTVNGRSVVHALEQFFSGVAGLECFYVLNIIVVALGLWLLVRLSSDGRRASLAQWVLGVFLLLYCLPEPARMLLSVNLSLNYVWPFVAVLGVLALFRRLQGAWRCGPWLAALFVPLGFVAGWSHEGYALPFSAAVFIYYAFHLRRWRGGAVTLSLGYWAGAATMFFAPGNWLRVGKNPHVIHSWDSFLQVLPNFFFVAFLLVLMAVLLVWKRRFILAVCGRNLIILIAWLLSLGMSAVFYTGARSLAPCVLFGIFMLMAIVGQWGWMHSRKAGIAAMVLAALMLVHQVAVTVEHYRQYRSVRDVLEAYEASSDGRVAYRYRRPPRLLEPFVYYLRPNVDGSTRYEWSLLCIHTARCCGTPQKKMHVSAVAVSPKNGATVCAPDK